jgi:hypothetical protein
MTIKLNRIAILVSLSVVATLIVGVVIFIRTRPDPAIAECERQLARDYLPQLLESMPSLKNSCKTDAMRKKWEENNPGQAAINDCINDFLRRHLGERGSGSEAVKQCGGYLVAPH